jgi:hypothetical protein
MENINIIINGDFPAGSKIETAGSFPNTDIFISWYEGFTLKNYSLKETLSEIKVMDKAEYSEGLSPLENGIVGGSVAGLDGFLAGYLVAPDESSGIIISCKTNEGLSFTAFVSNYVYEAIIELN